MGSIILAGQHRSAINLTSTLITLKEGSEVSTLIKIVCISFLISLRVSLRQQMDIITPNNTVIRIPYTNDCCINIL